jgi:hypothetical protein
MMWSTSTASTVQRGPRIWHKWLSPWSAFARCSFHARVEVRLDDAVRGDDAPSRSVFGAVAGAGGHGVGAWVSAAVFRFAHSGRLSRSSWNLRWRSLT